MHKNAARAIVTRVQTRVCFRLSSSVFVFRCCWFFLLNSQWHGKICHQKHTIKHINKTDVCNTCTEMTVAHFWNLHNATTTADESAGKFHRTTFTTRQLLLFSLVCAGWFSRNCTMHWMTRSDRRNLQVCNRQPHRTTLPNSERRWRKPPTSIANREWRKANPKCWMIHERIAVSYKYTHKHKMRLWIGGKWTSHNSSFFFRLAVALLLLDLAVVTLL